MPRQARIILPGVPHHVTQRGNNREAVFFSDHDRRHYLRLRRDSAERHGLSILAYCLMTNHVHIVVTPDTEPALAAGIGRAHLMYAQHVQRDRGLTGHFWQGRFKSCPLDPVHADTAIAYVELNPVRAGMCADATEYPWSSAAYHCGVSPDTADLLRDSAGWEALPPAKWKAKLDVLAGDTTLAESIRSHTLRGQPFGGKNFLRHVAMRGGRQRSG
jgi:putative transposase